MARSFTCPHCGKEVEVASGPRPGGVTYEVFQYVASHPEATRKDALDWGMAKGYNPLTVLTQFARARAAAKGRR